MKLKKAAAAMLAAALTAAASAGTQSWDFSDGIGDEWKLFNYPLSGDQEDSPWIVQDGALQQSDDHKWAAALVGKESWNNYTVQARMRINESGDHTPAHLIFAARFLSEHNFSCYLFAYSPEIKRVYLARQYADALSVGRSYEASEDRLDVEIGEWFNIRAHVEDGRFQCYINGVLAFDKRDHAYIGRGRVGFSAEYSAVSFDDLTVTGGSIEDVLSVDPEGSLAAQWGALKRE